MDRILSENGDKLVLKGENFPDGVQTFSEFVSLIPLWQNRSSSYVFHLDHPDVKDKSDVLVQRAQLSGLCYIHGPDLLQHYLVSMTSSVSVGMIDMSKLIRDTFTAKQLEYHIFDNKGGSSFSMLKFILTKGSNTFASENHTENLVRYGPGLVSYFEVYEDFRDNNKFSYSGIPTGDSVGLHAMVLIGYRKDEHGKVFYLLQNWWKDKQFVEVRYKL